MSISSTSWKRVPGQSCRCECGDHVFAPLTQGYTTMVSPEDAGLLRNKWFAVKLPRGRVIAARSVGKSNARRMFPLAREILSPSGDFYVDHVSGDPLDNRRPNLRLATPAQNAHNTRKKRGSKNPAKGVGQYPSGRFNAKIAVNGKRYNLGTFDTLPEARQAYAQAAARLHGEFARVE